MHGGRLVILSLILLADFCSAHVRLDFPAARDFALDFLDNIRTPAPCGMPKGKVKTSLIAGTTTNITWHLAYPHQGKQTIDIKKYNFYLLKCFDRPLIMIMLQEVSNWSCLTQRKISCSL